MEKSKVHGLWSLLQPPKKKVKSLSSLSLSSEEVVPNMQDYVVVHDYTCRTGRRVDIQPRYRRGVSDQHHRAGGIMKK